MREIARTIFSLVRERDYTFDEIGVLLTESNSYGPLLLETLSRLGIPCTLVAEQPLLATRQGKAVQALCQLLSEDCSRQRLFAFLRLAQPPFQDLIGEAVSRAHIAQWEALCLEAGIGRGGQEWHVRLAALEARYQDPPEEQAEQMAPAVRLLVRFMARLLTDVKMVQDQHTWEGWLAHFLRIYADYVSDQVSWSAQESDQQGEAEQGLNIEATLRRLSPFLAETTRPEEWVEAVLSCLAWGKDSTPQNAYARRLSWRADPGDRSPLSSSHPAGLGARVRGSPRLPGPYFVRCRAPASGRSADPGRAGPPPGG